MRTLLMCVGIAVRIYPPIMNATAVARDSLVTIRNHSTEESWNLIAARGKLSHLSLVFDRGSPRRVVLLSKGPIKYPCTVCKGSVKAKDRGIL